MISKINEIISRGLLAQIENIDLKKNHGYYAKIGIISETIGFMISRNNDATELTSENFLNDERALVPAQKWRAAERSYLLSELRKVGNVIPDGYARNMNKVKTYLKNPVSLLYGDTSIGSGKDMGSIASRCFYDWAYSFEPLGEISTRITHNTLSEDGTILHSIEGKTESNAIYNIPYIKPGVKFIRFVTLENCSLELLKLELIAILGTTRYGARTAILGDNVANHIVAIGFSKGDKPISSYELMQQAWESGKYEGENLIKSSMLSSYGEENVIMGDDLENFLNEVIAIKNNSKELQSLCEVINAKMENDWKEFWK
ncbi:hypothetical protein SE19_03105 [Acidiplasma aeolicum]|uniref:Type I-D CRISPR-associated protein Cas7/Csc2 n=2 Tax=Acidiplasma TaxID=507753 RepID=A0A0Q0RJU6_9ARCH|nr:MULTISPECIES: type I-D CRISPR-associated protein Cas7/Csc2 [Acidiplasma]KPV46975.1 hypothetical protein SE19_03105 [Acidiplasma aeolicum]KQB35308.1 hypothetical protein AOG54_03155 [Acidiplasma aeolicum]KQB35694.1 hypothetical protein AOG55_06095 [Acidiplasma cupricumulans]